MIKYVIRTLDECGFKIYERGILNKNCCYLITTKHIRLFVFTHSQSHSQPTTFTTTVTFTVTFTMAFFYFCTNCLCSDIKN